MERITYDFIVIGAGPAGLSAALYALRAGKRVLLLEEKVYGGQVIGAQRVENYPGLLNVSGLELAENMYNQVKAFGLKITLEKAEKIIDLAEGDSDVEEKIVVTDEGEYRGKAIVIATGAEARKLGVEREEELTGRGVSYCATCDGHFFKGKNVMVVGGGNTALQDALYLSDLANKVYLVHRRSEFRGDHVYVEKLRAKENVEFILDAKVTKLDGGQKLEVVTVENREGKLQEIPVEGIFVAVGYAPRNQAFSDVVGLDEKGYIKTKDGVHTNKKGIYVVGDARAKELKQLVTAVSDGAVAVDTAIREMS